jgi:hypothetical protein
MLVLRFMDTNKTHRTRKFESFDKNEWLWFYVLGSVLLNNIIETCVTSLVIVLPAVTDNMVFEYVLLFGFCTFAFRRGLEITKGGS